MHRKSLPPAAKLNVTRHIKAENQFNVCKALDIAGSIVQTILKNDDKIKKNCQIATPLSATQLNSTLCTSNHKPDFSTTYTQHLELVTTEVYAESTNYDLWTLILMGKVPSSFSAASLTPTNSTTLGMPKYILTNTKFKLRNVCEVEPLCTYRSACNITQMEKITTANKYFFSNWTLGVEHLYFFSCQLWCNWSMLKKKAQSLASATATFTNRKAQGYVTKPKSSHHFLYFTELLLIAEIQWLMKLSHIRS